MQGVHAWHACTVKIDPMQAGHCHNSCANLACSVRHAGHCGGHHPGHWQLSRSRRSQCGDWQCCSKRTGKRLEKQAKASAVTCGCWLWSRSAHLLALKLQQQIALDLGAPNGALLLNALLVLGTYRHADVYCLAAGICMVFAGMMLLQTSTGLRLQSKLQLIRSYHLKLKVLTTGWKAALYTYASQDPKTKKAGVGQQPVYSTNGGVVPGMLMDQISRCAEGELSACSSLLHSWAQACKGTKGLCHPVTS